MHKDWPWAHNPQDAFKEAMGVVLLSVRLLTLGFFSVLGTVERSGMWLAGAGDLVRRGRPNTWDYNGGVVAVYDEEGRPWIKRRDDEAGVIVETLIREYDLVKGACVPHSNDMGGFAEIMDSL
jgi:hypothetical protein